MRLTFSPACIVALARRLRLTVMSRLCSRFLLEVFYGEPRFANHQHTASAESQDCGSARDNCQSRGSVEESGLTIVGNNGTADGDKRGGGKQAKAGVKAAQ